SGVATLSNIPILYRLGPRTLYGPPGGVLLFTDNETNGARVFGPGHVSRKPYVKDAFHRWVVGGEPCTNPDQVGTTAAIHYRFDSVPPGGSVVLRLRLTDRAGLDSPLADVDAIVSRRRSRADAFYEAIHPPCASEDERRIQRQAFAGLLWSKQCYLFDVDVWLDGD